MDVNGPMCRGIPGTHISALFSSFNASWMGIETAVQRDGWSRIHLTGDTDILCGTIPGTGNTGKNTCYSFFLSLTIVIKVDRIYGMSRAKRTGWSVGLTIIGPSGTSEKLSSRKRLSWILFFFMVLTLLGMEQKDAISPDTSRLCYGLTLMAVWPREWNNSEK